MAIIRCGRGGGASSGSIGLPYLEIIIMIYHANDNDDDDDDDDDDNDDINSLGSIARVCDIEC